MNTKTRAERVPIAFSSVSYCINGLATQPILREVSFEVAEAETVVLLGRSGSGKTTLLRLVNRMLLPSGGNVLVQSRSTSDWDGVALRRGIGYVIQEAGLFPHFTVAQNVGLVPGLLGWAADRIAARS